MSVAEEVLTPERAYEMQQRWKKFYEGQGKPKHGSPKHIELLQAFYFKEGYDAGMEVMLGMTSEPIKGGADGGK